MGLKIIDNGIHHHHTIEVLILSYFFVGATHNIGCILVMTVVPESMA